MATDSEIQKEIIERMTALWGRPNRVVDSPEAVKSALAEYRQALGRFAAPVLKTAFEKVRDEWRGTSWPSVAAFVTAAKDATPSASTYREDGAVGYPAKAHAAMSSRLGQQALREGVGLSFYEYVERHGEHPHPAKITEWVRQKPENMRLALDLRDHPEKYVAAKNLLSIWEKMQDREREMQRKYGSPQAA